MPVMDGYEATRQIKQIFNNRFPNGYYKSRSTFQGAKNNQSKTNANSKETLHIVAVTAFVNNENINNCYEVGMS